VFHTRVSPLINLGLLTPREILDEVLERLLHGVYRIVRERLAAGERLEPEALGDVLSCASA